MTVEELKAKTFEERKLDMEVHSWLHANGLTINDYINKQLQNLPEISPIPDPYIRRDKKRE